MITLDFFTPNSKREKAIYKVLSKTHDLTRGNKVDKFHKKMVGDNYSVILCLQHLTGYIECQYGFIDSTHPVYNVYKKYLASLEALIFASSKCLGRKKCIPISAIRKALTAHTILFKNSNKIKSQVFSCHKDWDNIVLTSIITWNNAIRHN